ncbi:MAG: thioredoxin family protein [Hyphomonadaceae bacterium]|nr:thioredoxin family protein [Hyphomonadaceae bacterium]
MALRHSRMTELGASAPDFSLPDPAGRRWALEDFKGGQALLVAFICNHCPFVKHIAAGLAAYARDYAGKGVKIVAISPNDVESHPEDGPEKMAEFAVGHGFTFPYLYDESQETALAYEAICTPDFFLFDRDLTLAYRGRFDAATPGNSLAVTGADLRAATDALIAGRAPAADQAPSMGCSIKWKRDRAPSWA